MKQKTYNLEPDRDKNCDLHGFSHGLPDCKDWVWCECKFKHDSFPHGMIIQCGCGKNHETGYRDTIIHWDVPGYQNHPAPFHWRLSCAFNHLLQLYNEKVPKKFSTEEALEICKSWRMSEEEYEELMK